MRYDHVLVPNFFVVFGFLVFLFFFGFFVFFWFFGFFGFLFFWFSGFDTLVEDALVDTNSPCFLATAPSIFGHFRKRSEAIGNFENFRKQNLSESSEGPH